MERDELYREDEFLAEKAVLDEYEFDGCLNHRHGVLAEHEDAANAARDDAFERAFFCGC